MSGGEGNLDFSELEDSEEERGQRRSFGGSSKIFTWFSTVPFPGLC